MRGSTILGGVVVAALCVGLVTLVTPDSPVEDDTPRPAAQTELETRTFEHDPDAEAEVAALAERGKRSDRRKLQSRYAAWGGDDSKVFARRAVIDAMLARRFEDPKGALADLLAAIDADRELSGVDDPTIAYAATQARALWVTPGMFEHGRDKLLTARTDKSRAMLADSLSGFAAEGRDFVDPQDQRTAWLGSDLADAHSAASDGWAKQTIERSMATTMGPDVARVLADPLAVSPDQIQSLQDELQGVRAAVAEMPADDRRGTALAGLQDAEPDELVDAVARPLDSPRENPHRAHP